MPRIAGGGPISQPYKGRVVMGAEFEQFKKMTIGAKFKFVRQELEKAYTKKEFSLGKSANAAGISYQGLKNIEECIVSEPYKYTVKELCRAYNLPEKIFNDNKYLNSIEGFIIGKEQDIEAFFRRYQSEHFFPHILDPKAGQVSMLRAEDEIVDIDLEGYDVVRNTDGSITLDRYIVEIYVDIYQSSSGDRIERRTLVAKREVAPQDIDHIKGLIEREVDMLEKRHKQLLELKSKLKGQWSLENRNPFDDGAGAYDPKDLKSITQAALYTIEQKMKE